MSQVGGREDLLNPKSGLRAQHLLIFGEGALWRRMDFNGNNIVSLAEIDKWVVEAGHTPKQD